MQEMLSSKLTLYIITIILTVLFLLQLWAILRIKEMLRQVAEIFRFVRAGSLASRRLAGEKQPSHQRICENCRFRKTYISNDPEFEIYYHCKKHHKEILLNESCYLFEFDEQNKEN
jgi:hypothetical protein